MAVLNPQLYWRLRAVFKEVKIHNNGEYCTFYIDSGKRRLSSWGECYSVSCPFCNDEKSHLWISYIWGQRLSRFDEILRPAVCYRRNCLKYPQNRIKLIQLLSTSSKPLVNVPSKRVSEHTSPLVEVELPPGCIPLNYLQEDHQAIQYLYNERHILEKGYSVDDLVCDFDLYVTLMMSQSPRIIVPIYKDGKLYSWVGRAYLPDLEPKYLYCPDSKVSHLLFNMDRVKFNEPVVIVEGVFDLFTVYYNVTRNVVALFGKVVHEPQSRFLNKIPSLKLLCLDSDAVSDARVESRKLKNCKVLELSKDDPDNNVEEVKRLYEQAVGVSQGVS